MKTLFNHDYRPTTLVADAADEITNGFMAAFGYFEKEWITNKRFE